MDSRYATKLQVLADSVLTTTGDTDPALRRSVEERAAELGGRPAVARDELPEALAPYVDTVAMRAHETTDEDIAALQRAGYSEDAIFEVTLSAALGAGLSRLARGLAALRGETP